MTMLHYIEGRWHDGNPPILGPMTHATWMASVVFDGARVFEGVAPDMDLHCGRLIESARTFGLEPVVAAGEIHELVQDGVARFKPDTALYVRPMFWAESGFVVPDPKSTRFCLTIFEQPLPEPNGAAVCLSSFRRPMPSMAPTLAKASCLYPNSGRALVEASQKGFDNAVLLDGIGNVAELATANIWIAKDGAAHTPAPNGCFLNGITKQRVASLLQKAGIPVYERAIGERELAEADEIFQTGNLGKVLPITRYEDRNLQPGPIYSRARELYWDYAHE
ncbi:MAG: branched-chain amino acid aminotransferase [Pseudomonadota bacterium]